MHEADHQEEKFEGVTNDTSYKVYETSNKDKFEGQSTEVQNEKSMRELCITEEGLGITTRYQACGGNPRGPHDAEGRERIRERTDEEHTERSRRDNNEVQTTRHKASGTNAGGGEDVYEEESKRRRTEHCHKPGSRGAHRRNIISGQEAE